MINRNMEFYKNHEDDRHYLTSIEGNEINELINKYGNVLNVKIGKPETPGSERQNRAMHSLLTAFYVSGFASLPENCTLDKFKILKKLAFGPCYDLEYQGQQVRVPISWSNYSKGDRVEFINCLIAEITQSGALAESPKLQEIIKGMSEEK